MAWLHTHDNSKTTLASELDIDDLTIALTAGASFPATGQFILTICAADGSGLEKILIDSRSTNTLTANASGRAYGGTAASVHAAGSQAFIGSIEHSLDEIQTAVDLNTAKVTNATHSGEVTGDTALTIAANAVTLAKLATQAANTFLVNATGGAAVPTAETCTAAGRALLDDANAAAQLVTLGAVPLAGGTMTGDITLAENAGLALDPAASADEKWSGITVTGTAGATLAVGDLCYLNSGWEWVLTDANAASTAGSVALGLCILAANNDGATRMLLMGTMKSAAFPASITGGAQLYVSTTAGDMTTTQPTGVDDVIRVVGWAILTEPNTILFSPSPDFITRTA